MTGGLRDLIQEQVANDEQIKGMLAQYAGSPAFFYNKAPADSRPGWQQVRYPRADFNIDTRQDPERKTAGTLIVNIFCTTECPQIGDQDPDRAIELRLIELLSGTFYTDREEGIFCAEWNRTDAFTLEGSQTNETHPEVYGLTMLFDVLAFPPQFTIEPDPVQGLNRWIKDHFEDGMTAIAYDELPVIFRPSDKQPAIYWRFDGSITTDAQSYAVTWYTGTFFGHVLTGTVMERNRWVKTIVQKMQTEGEVILPDTSPMFINRITIRHSADPIRTGQIEVAGRFGVLEQPAKEHDRMRMRKGPTDYVNQTTGKRRNIRG